MMFRRKTHKDARLAIAVAVTMLVGAGSPVLAGMGTAVVPTTTIYPGEEITSSKVDEVDVTNPNLAGEYARTSGEVLGMVAKRTLLPGRTIPPSALRDAFAVTRGSPVRLVFVLGGLSIAATGSPLDNAAVGDVIKVRNVDSGVTVSGTVMADGTVQVMAK